MHYSNSAGRSACRVQGGKVKLCTHSNFLVLAFSTLLTACCPPIQHIDPPVLCDISAERLAENCAQPSQIPLNATYGDILKIHLADRQALESCKKSDDFLKKQVLLCQTKLKKYGEGIEELNQQSSSKKPK